MRGLDRDVVEVGLERRAVVGGRDQTDGETARLAIDRVLAPNGVKKRAAIRERHGVAGCEGGCLGFDVWCDTSAVAPLRRDRAFLGIDEDAELHPGRTSFVQQGVDVRARVGVVVGRVAGSTTAFDAHLDDGLRVLAVVVAASADNELDVVVLIARADLETSRGETTARRRVGQPVVHVQRNRCGADRFIERNAELQVVAPGVLTLIGVALCHLLESDHAARAARDDVVGVVEATVLEGIRAVDHGAGEARAAERSDLGPGLEQVDLGFAAGDHIVASRAVVGIQRERVDNVVEAIVVEIGVRRRARTGLEDGDRTIVQLADPDRARELVPVPDRVDAQRTAPAERDNLLALGHGLAVVACRGLHGPAVARDDVDLAVIVGGEQRPLDRGLIAVAVVPCDGRGVFRQAVYGPLARVERGVVEPAFQVYTLFGVGLIDDGREVRRQPRVPGRKPGRSVRP